MKPVHTIAELARLVGGELRGDGCATITGVADVRDAGPGEATWVSRDSFVEKLKSSRAGVVLVPKHFGETPMPAILCDKIEPAIAALLGAFATPVSRPADGIHPTAVVDKSATIGERPAIGPHVVLEAGVRIGSRCVLHAGVFVGRDTVIGDDCELWPNAVIRNGCQVGSRVSIHPCAVIGKDGFGFYFNGTQHIRIPHVGGVIIEDDVEIGACSCVDRAKFGNTVVARGTKIDNQVQVAHNCRVGQHNAFAGHTGLSGSVRTGDYCVMGGRATVFDNVNIGHQVQLGGMTVVTKDLPDGLKASGFPAQELQTELREKAAVRRLPEYYKKIKDLIERVERLEASAHHNP